VKNRAVAVTLKWIVSLAIGALFVWLSVDEWPADRMLAGARVEGMRLVTDTWSVHLGILPIYFLTLISMHLFRFWRWQPLLNPLGRVGFWTLNKVCSVGFLAVFVLPMRFGELVRPALISTEAPIRRSAALATIVLERLVDGVMVAGFLAVALAFMPRINPDSYEELRYATVAALIVFSAAVAALGVLYAFRGNVSQAARRFVGTVAGSRMAGRVAGIVDRFLLGLSVLPDWKGFVWFLFLSFFYWFSNGIGLFILGLGFEGIRVDLLLAFAMMSTIVVGMMIPNAPANVGSFWFFLLLPTKLYGHAFGAPEAGLAFALVVWTLQFLQLIVFGGWYVAKGDVPLRRAFAVTSPAEGQGGQRSEV
jgi:hypothetical protein